MHRVLEQATKKSDRAEIFHLQRKVIPVRFDAQGLSVIKTTQTEGIALRAICDGRLGYSTSTDLSHPELIVDAAVATAAFGAPTALEFPSAPPPMLPAIGSDEIKNVTAETLVDLGESIRAAMMRAGDDVEIGVSVEAVVDRVRVANTSGLDVEETRTAIEVNVEATLAREGDIFTLGDSLQVRTLADLTPERATSKLLRLLELGREVVPAPSGSLPVLFTATGALAVFLPLIIGLNGKQALLGLSPLADKLGQSVFDGRIRLSDNGRHPDGARTGSFDDEGSVVAETMLVEDGVVQGFYYDLRTAKQAGAEPTGNGYKGGMMGGCNFRPVPSCSLGHVILGEGAATDEEMIGDIKQGLLVESVLGLGQGNLNAGDFSNNVSAAFLIENGQIVGRVKNAMIAGNSYDLLKNHVIGLGDKSEWVYGRLLSPSIALAHVNVAAK